MMDDDIFAGVVIAVAVTEFSLPDLAAVQRGKSRMIEAAKVLELEAASSASERAAIHGRAKQLSAVVSMMTNANELGFLI